MRVVPKTFFHPKSCFFGENHVSNLIVRELPMLDNSIRSNTLNCIFWPWFEVHCSRIERFASSALGILRVIWVNRV
jgi:hypothetical protein